MKKLFKRTSWITAGLMAALTCGIPAVADDTELLLVSPNQNTVIKPNVLLIIDPSRSMTTLEETREVYDYQQAYEGGVDACDPDYLYWSELKDVVPGCSDSNARKFLKTSFLCDHATRQLQGIGLYTNKLVQFRTGGSGGLDAERWQQLEPGNESDIVECQKDRGIHGDGSSDAVHAQKGGDVEPFTTDQAKEVSWSSWPTNQSVTVYDGNYLNYRENPVLVQSRRIDIVNSVAKSILNSISDINVGIMRFNFNQGGPVILDIQDLDANRAGILATIDGIDAAGTTPVSETLYEAARFWRGLPAYYGEIVDEHPTDPNALKTLEPESYEQPQSQVCAKNFNVLLSDGEPNEDEETPSLVDNLPDWFATQGYAGCSGTNEGDCLDDVAGYLQNVDISSDEGEQNVTTHTIGFAIDLPLLEATAAAGGGDYFLADDVESLTTAFLEIVNNITDRSLSFAAPAVAVNTFNRTRNLNDLYMTTFAAREKYHWPGNLKKYEIADGKIVDRNGDLAVNPDDGLFFDSAASFWSSGTDGSNVDKGGALENLPEPALRKLYTNQTTDNDLTAAANTLTPSNADTFSLADLGLTGAQGEPSKDELIRWALGEDVQDEDSKPETTTRKAMGDPLHSQPAAVVYGGDAENPEVVVYMATNDGYVHAIDASDGSELWAFIPKEHLPKLPSLYINADASFKTYGVDGDIVPIIADRDGDGTIEPADGDFVYIMFGMRRGGNSYYMLDVTNRNSPQLKWRADAAGFGQSWSRPTIARVDIDDTRLNDDKAVVIIGGGYDNVHDTLPHPSAPDTQGAGVYFLDLESGEVLWRAGADVNANLELSDLTRSIPSQIRVIDITGDGFADRMYAADMGGQILRFDITNGNTPDSLVTGGAIAQLGAEGNAPAAFEDTRRFYNTPDVSIFNDNIQDRRFIAISIGSGYRAHPLDNTNSDRFYSIRDKAVFNSLTQDQYDNLTPITDADLVEVSGQVGAVIGQDQVGWKLTLPADQKVLSTSATFNNEVFFVAFSPDVAEAENCAAGTGRNFLYRVAVANGDPIADLDNVVPGTEDQLRVQELAQGGIAPAPSFLFPAAPADCTGAACAPPPIGCVGVECFSPGFANVPVRTLWTQDGIE
jgi:type IV pilus assembly protein PilY1